MKKTRKLFLVIPAILVLCLAIIFGLKLFFTWSYSRVPRINADKFSVVEVKKIFYNSDDSEYVYKDVSISSDNFISFSSEVVKNVSGKKADGTGFMIGGLPLFAKIYLEDNANNTMMIKIYKGLSGNGEYLGIVTKERFGQDQEEYFFYDLDKYIDELTTLDLSN